MAAVNWPIAGFRRLSRRAVAGLFAAGSVLTSRPAADVLATASDLSDIGVGLFFVYRMLGGGNALASIVLTYVLFGYLVYAYTPELYPGLFGDVVEARGFRALTAITTLYFGFLFGQTTGLVMDVGPFRRLPDTGDTLVAITVGIPVSVLVFYSYFRLLRGQRVSDRASHLYETRDAMSPEPLEDDLEKVEQLPERRRRVVLGLMEISAPGLYAAPAVFLGVTLPIVAILSPFPEGLVAVAVLGSYVPLGGRLTARLPRRSDGDIEFRIADTVVDTFRNLKGMILAMVCVQGMGFSGVILVTAGTGIVALGTENVATPSTFWILTNGVLLARRWFEIGLVISLLTYGLYGVLYWFRQLQRLPAYATFWEAYWYGESRSAAVPSVTRPPGLFLPGTALLLGVVAVRWLAPDGEPLSVLVGWGVVLPVLVGLVVWSVLAGSRRPPQPRRGEGRAVLIAYGIQFVVMGVALSVSIEVWLGLLLFFVGITYVPEINAYSDHRRPAAGYLKALYMAGICVVLVFPVRSFASVPRTVYLLIAGVWLVYLVLIAISPSDTDPSARE